MQSEPPKPLPPDRLYRRADLSASSFRTTAELAPVDHAVGQGRAMQAIGFGSRIRKAGFNLFVIGPHGARMQDTVQAVLAETAPPVGELYDWVYVNNFTEPRKPIAVRLPAGRAPAFRDAMQELVADLRIALPAAFEREDYQTRRAAIDQAFQAKQNEAFTALRDKAAQQNIVVLRTPMGFMLAPARDGQVIPPEEFNAWPEERRREVQEVIQALEKDLEQIMRQAPRWEKDHRDEIRKLNRETAILAVGQSIDEAKAGFADIPELTRHLDAVRSDLVDNAGLFMLKPEGEDQAALEARGATPFDRYEVNVLVSQQGPAGRPPIMEEPHPTLGNLIGTIEYVARQGVLATNFHLIKAGAMHRANGGFLLLDVRHLLTEPFSWAALKRTLRQHEIRIEDMSRFLGLASTVSLEPDPIPLDIKVVLFGDRVLYYLMTALDPEVGEHFKVLADFEDDIDRSPESEAVHARLIAAIAKRGDLKPIDREGVARILEHCARLADHSGKLTLLVDEIRDLLAEADFWANEAKRDVVTRPDVEKAIDEKRHRAGRLEDRARESILQNIALIDTTGLHLGQVNGLSVLELGGHRFGRPSRITCRVRPGAGRVVDIEREVELGGPIHSKGVLILGGFLAGRYALETPMSLSASLVFEQSYGGVEGDSASSAELYTLLSALSGLPLRQDLAVTGSVNQHGAIQAIGGANEKIEGFFDVCKAKGLTGAQGVLIPVSNVQHLMLRSDVVEACAAGRFAVYPVGTIDEGIALLTGAPAGERGADGAYPEGSVNRRVEDCLRDYARIRHRFAEQAAAEAEGRRT